MLLCMGDHGKAVIIHAVGGGTLYSVSKKYLH